MSRLPDNKKTKCHVSNFHIEENNSAEHGKYIFPVWYFGTKKNKTDLSCDFSKLDIRKMNEVRELTPTQERQLIFFPLKKIWWLWKKSTKFEAVLKRNIHGKKLTCDFRRNVEKDIEAQITSNGLFGKLKFVKWSYFSNHCKVKKSISEDVGVFHENLLCHFIRDCPFKEQLKTIGERYLKPFETLQKFSTIMKFLWITLKKESIYSV